MKKTLQTIAINLIFASAIAAPAAAQVATTTDVATVATSTTAVNLSYRAVVKVNTFVMASGYNLSLYGSGSGVFINDSGLILTNNHVIDVQDDFDNSSKPTAYQICLPQNTTDEPDCSYLADVVAKNKDLDMAMLQLKPISGLSSASKVPYLNLNLSDSAQINDEITAIGYPGIGNGSITVTKGVMSGKTEKYGKKWIKTDAVISFGSSGGAAIDRNGQLIGITSAGHSDFLGSLGYLINIASINNWIESNRYKAVIPGVLEPQLEDFTRTEKRFKSDEWYASDKFGFKIKRPSGWEFNITQEDSINIEKADDEDAGSFSIEILQSGRKTDMAQIEFIANELKEQDLSFMNVLSQKKIRFAGRDAKKITLGFSGMDTQMYNYLLPVENNIFKITFFYGKDEKNKAEIESILSSFKLTKPNKPFKAIKKYSQTNPVFSLEVDGDWSLSPDNSKAYPLSMQHRTYNRPNAVFIITKVPKELSKYDNSRWLKYSIEQVEKSNKNSYNDNKTKITAKNAHFKLNAKLRDVIMIESEVRDTKKNKVIAYAASIIIRRGDKNINILISDETSRPDKKNFKKVKQEIIGQLKKFEFADRKFGNGSPVMDKDTDGDGLSDVDEAKYGTDPHNVDSDGDGFKDGEEVRAGYNPLGVGD